MNATTLIHEKSNSAIVTVYFIGDNFYLNDYENFAKNMKNVYNLNYPDRVAGWFILNYNELFDMYKQLTIELLPTGLLAGTIFFETITFFKIIKKQTNQINYANLFDESGKHLWV